MWRILLDPAPAEGNGNPAPTPVPTPTPAPAASDLTAKVYGDIDRLRTERDEARAKLPKAGAIVIEAGSDEHAAYEAFRKLGKAPAELATMITEHATATAELATHRREKLVATLAGSVDFDAEVLSRLLPADVETEMRDVTLPGNKAAKVGHVKDGGVYVPLDKWAEKHHPKFLPSLRKGAGTATATTAVSRASTRTSQPAAEVKPLRISI